jgi:hypothetical protein
VFSFQKTFSQTTNTPRIPRIPSQQHRRMQFFLRQQEDSCIQSFRFAKAVEKFYGLPLQTDAEFV